VYDRGRGLEGERNHQFSVGVIVIASTISCSETLLRFRRLLSISRNRGMCRRSPQSSRRKPWSIVTPVAAAKNAGIQYGAQPPDNSKSTGNALHLHRSLLNIVLHD
jgi:hypothetical protein